MSYKRATLIRPTLFQKTPADKPLKVRTELKARLLQLEEYREVPTTLLVQAANRVFKCGLQADEDGRVMAIALIHGGKDAARTAR